MSTGFVLNIPQEMINRLDLADQKIEKLAKTSEDSRNRIIAAFQQVNTQGIDAFIQRLDVAQQKLAALGGTQINMGVNANTSGFQQLIDAINNLSQASKTNITINGLGTVGNQTQTAIDAINKLMATLQQLQQMGGQQFLGGVNSLGRQTLREMNREAKKMQKTMQDLDDAIQKYGISATDLANKLQQARQAQQQFNDAAKQQAQADVSGLIGMKGQQTTLNELKNYANELKRTMANLDPKSQEWAKLNNIYKQTNKEIKNIQNSMKDVQKQSRSLMDISGQLARRLALVFSVSQITGYVKKLIEVRGEFELQQRSLQAILQNKDEANRIWQQTVDLAVRSPFRVKELVSYTKQLAAYRIESDKLFETNKMLADISAGLGVDMQRLILAFGQVRSAAYLRGTELRQFTEAGIPILEQLAQYFTELEGRAVSVGDVFERVSKRMVSFADVEEIFKRMTSEGGTFYRMQEIQAETLQGQISNLKDSVDIMLNDIGKANETTLKNSVALVRGVVENWEEIAAVAVPVLGSLITRWGLFKASTMQSSGALSGFFKTFGKHFGVVITQLTRGTRVAKAFAKATEVSIMGGWATVILAVVAAIGVLVRSIQNATKAKRELEKIDLSGAFDASRSVAEYKRLAEVVADTSKSYDEQQKALSTLKTKYEDILPAHLLESNTIKALKGNYDEATNAIYDYIAAKTKEKQIEVIQTELGADVETQAGDLADDIRKSLAKVAPNITRADVLPIVNKLRELIQVGDVNVLNIDETIKNLVKEFTGLEISADAWKYTFSAANGEMITLEDNAESLVVALDKMKRAMNEVTSSSLRWQDSFVYQDFNKVREGYEKQNEAIGKYYETIRRYEQEREDKGENGVSDELRRDYEAATNALNNIFTEANQKAPEWSTIINEPFKLNEATINANKILWEKMIADINAMPVLPSKAGAKQNYVELLEDELEAFAGTAKQQEVARVAQDLADTMRVSLEGLDELFLKSDESLSDYAKRISRTLEQYKTGVLQFDTDIKNGTKFGDYTKEQVSLMREQIPFLEEFLRLFEAFLTPKKGNTEDTFSPMLRTVKEIYQEFKKLQGSFDDLTAKEGALAKFGDAFKEAFGKTPEEMGFDLFSEEGVKAAYDYLISKAPDAKKRIQAELAKGEIVWDVKLQKKKDTDKELLDNVQELFDRYDLSLELKKLNIPSDLAKSLFDVDYLDLDGLKKAVQEQEAKFIGTDREDEYKKFLEKIDDMEDKAAKERMKTYSKYLLEGMSERVKLKIEELRKLKEIEESSEFSPEQKERIKEGVSKESRVEQQKQEWKDFQGTEMYTMMFEDLEHYGSAAIDMLYTKLSELKTSLSDLPASEVKEIVSQIEKLENIQIERNPFEYLKIYKDEVKNIGFTEDELQTQLLDSQKAEEDAQKYIDIYNTVMQSLMSEDEGVFEEIDAETLSQWNQMLRLAEEQGKTVEEILADRKATVKTEQDNQGKIVKNLNSYKKLSKAQKESLELTQEWLTQVGNLFSSSKDLMESLGVESDSVAMTIADTGSSMVSLIGSAIQFTLQLDLMGVAANSALGIIGWIAIALQAVATVLSAIFSAKDKALQKEIDGHLARAEKLHEKYEELSDAIDSAYDASVVRQFNKEIEKTIQLEIKAIEAAIAAEKSQKDSKIDWGWVDEQEKKVKELYNTLNEEHDSYIERWGGFGSDEARFDFIESMTQAWLDSFKETGDGLDGLEEKWDEYFDNLAMKQMAIRVSKKAVDEYLDLWDKYVSAESVGGEDLTEAEAQDLRLKKEQLLKDLSERYTNLAESLGITPTTEGGGLSALSKSIQGVSESTAQVLESLLNSMRFYVADSNAKLTQLLNNMMSGETESPMLAELRAQTKWMRDIYNLINGMTATHPSGGRGIKTVM